MPSETYILSLHDALPISLTKLATKDLVPGEVMSRSTADADSITRIFGQIGTGVSALTGFAVSAIFLLFSDWLVGLIVLIIAPVISLIVASTSKGISQRSAKQQATLAAAGEIGRASCRARGC